MKIKNIILYTILALVLITIIAFVCIMNTNGIAGYKLRYVVSNSMEPAIHKNSIVIIKDCSISEIQTGDIICYNNPITEEDVLHRVVSIEDVDDNIILHTKGDNNKNNDLIDVTYEMLVGKLVWNW